MTAFDGINQEWIFDSIDDFLPKETRPYIFRIPVELIIEILNLLEWSEVLHVRRTCKYLADVTTSRAIWKRLVDEYVLTSVMPPKIERPLESHSSKELETLLLRWKSADLAFESDKFRAPRERTFMGPKTDSVRIIRGGRWLLGIQRTAAVKYYDLDAETAVGVNLIPAQIEVTDGSRITTTIEYDMDSPFLQFNIAFCYQSRDALDIKSHKFQGHYCICKIWNVAAILDDTNHVIGLIATEVAWFPFDMEVRAVPTLSLLGSNLACITNLACLTPSYKPCQLRIINWRQAHQNPLHYQFRVVEKLELQASIQLLPTGKILVTECGNYKLYDYLSIPESKYTPEQPTCSYQPIWNIEGPSSDWPFSCFFTGTRAYAIIGQYRLVTMLAFEYASPTGAPPSMNVIARNEWACLHRRGCCVGAKRTIAIVRPPTIRIFEYSQFMKSAEQAVFRQEGTLKIRNVTYIVADDDIGRCVCLYNRGVDEKYRNQTKFLVVDFGRPPN